MTLRNTGLLITSMLSLGIFVVLLMVWFVIPSVYDWLDSFLPFEPLYGFVALLAVISAVGLCFSSFTFPYVVLTTAHLLVLVAPTLGLTVFSDDMGMSVILSMLGPLVGMSLHLSSPFLWLTRERT